MSGQTVVAVSENDVPSHESLHDEAPFETAADEKDFFDARNRQRRERAEKRDAQQLENVESRMRVYRKLACRSGLSHAQFRVLCELLEAADLSLDNAFPLRRTVARALDMKLGTYDTHFARLREAGWVRTHEFRRADGTQSSSGVQFCVPPGVINEGGWCGPARFSKRQDVARRQKGGNAVTDSVSNGCMTESVGTS